MHWTFRILFIMGIAEAVDKPQKMLWGKYSGIWFHLTIYSSPDRPRCRAWSEWTHIISKDEEKKNISPQMKLASVSSYPSFGEVFP